MELLAATIEANSRPPTDELISDFEVDELEWYTRAPEAKTPRPTAPAGDDSMRLGSPSFYACLPLDAGEATVSLANAGAPHAQNDWPPLQRQPRNPVRRGLMF